MAHAFLAARGDVARLGGARSLTPGDEATVRLPGQPRARRLTFLYAEPDGTLTFSDPTTGNRRTVRPDRVRTVHRSRQLHRTGTPPAPRRSAR